MRRHISLAFALILILGLILAGCSQSASSPSASKPAETKAQPIKIAVLGPMSDQSGTQIWWNTSMAADEINSAGGVSVGGIKRPIELIKVDTNEIVSTPDAVSAIERAITVNKADFIVGAWNSEPVMAMMDVAADYKKVFISEGASPSMSARVKKDYDRYKYWFRAYYNTADAVPYYFACIPQFINLVKTEFKIDTPKVAVVVDKAAWVDPLLPYTEKTITAAGGSQVGVWRPSTTATDVSAELLAVKDAGAQIIYHVMYGPSSLVLARQWDELKIPAALIGVNGQAAYPTFMKASNGAGNYIETLGTPRAAITDLTLPWWDKFTKLYGEEPQSVWSFFYQAIYTIKNGVEKAGTLDSDAVVKQIEKTDGMTIFGRLVYQGIDTNFPHDIKTGPGYTVFTGGQWQNGKFVGVWPPPDGSWNKVVIPGFVAPQLPPWMYTAWKK